MRELLPVHGFVLAGGGSTRMGQDKAMLPLRGLPMVEVSVRKLQGLCESVGIVGNRDDLARFSAVARETRVGIGPGAGLEAGLLAASQSWAMFLPVDVPLVPTDLLRAWTRAVLQAEAHGCVASYPVAQGRAQPAFCLVKRCCLPAVTAALDGGERRLGALLAAAAREEGDLLQWEVDSWADEAAGRFPSQHLSAFWFHNVNTPAELADAERLAAEMENLR